jgi:hypothetical protein
MSAFIMLASDRSEPSAAMRVRRRSKRWPAEIVRTKR